MNISKVLLNSFSSNMNKITKPITKSSYMSRQVLFAFVTTRNVVSDADKIGNLLPQVESIKVWSLQELIQNSYQKSQDGHIGGSPIKSSNSTSNESQNLFRKLSETQNDSLNIVINNYFSTIQDLSSTKNQQQVNTQQQNQKALCKKLISLINQSQKWSFVPHYQNIINRQKLSNKGYLKLLIGDYNDSIIGHFPQNSYVTLEQLCAMYPQKVPLSYRKRQTIENIRQSISKRLSQGRQQKINLDQEPRFNEIIIINDRIKMWDQAYQIMLDELPIKITVPFHLIQSSQKFHRLNLHNFIQGFRTCHRIIHPEIPLQIQHQNLQQFLSEYLKNISKDSPTKKSKIQVEVMDQSISQNNGKRFQILL